MPGLVPSAARLRSSLAAVCVWWRAAKSAAREMLITRIAAAVPAGCGLRRPGGGLILVAVAARVGRAVLHRFVRPRNAETVVVALIDHHVGAHRHVAGRAAALGALFLVVVMARRGVLGERVAASADLLVRHPQLLTVRVMAVAAGHAGGEHAALHERAVVVHLVLHLPVGGVHAFFEQRNAVGISQWLRRAPVFGNLGRARVTASAGLQLLRVGARLRAVRIAGGGIEDPGNAPPVIKVRQQPVIVQRPGALRAPLRRSPLQVRGTCPVAGLAGDTDILPAGAIAVGGRVVVLSQVGRVTLGAHVIPVLLQLGPVQLIARADVLVRVQVHPALAALRARTGIPGDRQRLQPTIRKGHQILLQRIDPEGVADFKVLLAPIRTVSADEELVVPAVEARGDLAVHELRIVKVAQDRRRGGFLHGKLMVRAQPVLVLRCVASLAGLRPDVERWCGRRHT